MSASSIVITGLGAVTPYGVGIDTLWQNLLKGNYAISDMDLFDLGGIACTQAGVVRNFALPAPEPPMPRGSGFALAACREALAQAGLLQNTAQLADTALITATNFGDIGEAEPALLPLDHAKRDPASAIHASFDATTAQLADRLGLGGPQIPLSLSCASGASAVATAAWLIETGYSERVVAVGYDALSRFAWSGLCALRTMTREKVRPFDVRRSGTIFSEGAAALVIERETPDHSGVVKPLATLLGWATNNNGFHLTAPPERASGSMAVMRESLERAGLGPEMIGHINAHGTGTRPNDLTEAQAIHDLFGACAATIPVTSVKGLLGHMLGAAGAVETVISVLTLHHGVIPPTGNLDTPDPECNLNVTRTPAPLKNNKPILGNSAGFGGCNAALVIGRHLPGDQPYHSAQMTRQPVAIAGMGVVERQPNDPMPDLAEYGVAPKAYLDPASALFLCACGEAIEDSGIETTALAERAGVMCGTAWGCATTAMLFFADYTLKGPRLVKPFLFPHAYANTPASLAAIEWSLSGAHENVAGGDTASGIALLEAFDLIKRAPRRVILAGGVDTPSPLHADTPPTSMAVTLLLESGESAQARNAKPLGYLVSGAIARSGKTALANALVKAEMDVKDLDLVVDDKESLTSSHGADGTTAVRRICQTLPRLRPAERGAVVTSHGNTSVAFILQNSL